MPLLVAAQTQPAARATAPQTQALPAPSAVAVPPPAAARFQVLIDAAHGGTDTGAHLTPELEEKALTLNLSNQLRALLAARGIAVTTTRSNDENLSPDERAAIANRTPFAACILIHATATGSGVHLYASSLAATPLVTFMPWHTVQSGYVTQSLKVSSDIDSALAQASIPVTLGRTSLQPLNSFACPAVAVEIAPLQAGSTSKAKAITDEGYQQTILNALATALEEWRSEWRQKP
ncbi:MAG TPA: N-acetylmuramoyl-L-alanine amidase [Acidobacteriaceae bacterium]|nr:N-acetylmuramoyl-L-alanine amidase [Acidobacteriaceae bacterium]